MISNENASLFSNFTIKYAMNSTSQLSGVMNDAFIYLSTLSLPTFQQFDLRYKQKPAPISIYRVITSFERLN